MKLLPPHDIPKPGLRRLIQAMAIGAGAGAGYGGIAGYFTDDAFLFVICALGGAFAGFLIWTTDPNVLWGRRDD